MSATTKPILFGDSMVRAILEGRKTQTRRIVKPPRRKIAIWDSPDTWFVDSGGTIFGPGPYVKMDWWHKGDISRGTSPSWARQNRPSLRQMDRVRCPYGYPEYGDRLWVREAWCQRMSWGGDLLEDDWWYRASNPDVVYAGDDAERADGTERSPWRPSIHMPRKACRLVLRITRVRVERLRTISKEDALAEGVWGSFPLTHSMAFASVWDEANGKRAPWNSNPWVWVLDFEVER